MSPRLALALCAGLGGCATAGSFQTAHTVGPGGWELGADGSALVIADRDSGFPWLVLPRAAGRIGVSERTELGGSVGLDGIQFGPRVQLTDPSDEGVVVTVGVEGKVLPVPSPGLLVVLTGLEESVYVGVPASEMGQLVLFGRGAQDVGFGGGREAVLLWAGGGVGWNWQVDDRFRLMPEVGLMVPVLTATDGGNVDGLQGLIVQGGLGCSFGQRR